MCIFWTTAAFRVSNTVIKPATDASTSCENMSTDFRGVFGVFSTIVAICWASGCVGGYSVANTAWYSCNASENSAETAQTTRHAGANTRKQANQAHSRTVGGGDDGARTFPELFHKLDLTVNEIQLTGIGNEGGFHVKLEFAELGKHMNPL